MLAFLLQWCLFFSLNLGATVSALEPPAHTSLVIDQVGWLDSREQIFLHKSLEAFEKKYGPQVQVLIIPSLEGEEISAFSIKVVDQWKLGQKGKDNGILLLITKAEKQLRIEVGRGLEGDITDALAGRIIDQGIKPYFQQGKFRDGIYQGLNLIAVSLGGSLEGTKVSRLHPKYESFSPSIFFVLLIILFFIISLLQRLGIFGSTMMHSSYRRGGYGGAWGGGSRGSFRGGFGGGGGGGFSGGGASGNW